MRKPPLGKMDIVKLLRGKYALGEVLEISTPTTGLTFTELKDDVPDAHRLVYNCPAGMDDGQTYTYRTEAITSEHLTKAVLAANRDAPCYDIVFVDPFHTYACSAADLKGAFALFRPGGIMVVHDCNPECASLTAPEFVPGDWLGVTYMAFIDSSSAVRCGTFIRSTPTMAAGWSTRIAGCRAAAARRSRTTRASAWPVPGRSRDMTTPCASNFLHNIAAIY